MNKPTPIGLLEVGDVVRACFIANKLGSFLVLAISELGSPNSDFYLGRQITWMDMENVRNKWTTVHLNENDHFTVIARAQ